MLTCPNCGYKQSSGDKCQKCSSLFSYYLQSATQHEAPSEKTDAIAPQASVKQFASRDGFFISWRTAYRITSWSSLVLLVVVLVLVLHKAPPPKVTVNPQAAARAEAKLSQAEAAAQQNQPAQVTLDRTELNSYLNSNLQLPSAGAKPDATASTSTANTPAAPDASAQLPDDASVQDVQSAVKDVKVDLDGDLVKAYVIFNFHGKDLSLELDGHLSSSNGYLQFAPTAGELGSLPLPQSTLDAAVEKLMSSPEDREKLRLPAGVSDIKVVNGQVVVNYQ